MRTITLSMILVVATLDAGAAAAAASAPQAPPHDTVVFVAPTRRPPDAAPAAPPDLPAGANDVGPLTFEMVTTRKPRNGAQTVQRQTVSRTKDRVHVATDGKEWLFERNTVDPRRVSASLIHHPSKTIVVHEESDLRNTLGLNGWADVLTLGSDPGSPQRLTPRAFSIRHESGVTSVAIKQAQPHARAELLRPPTLRFPDYKVLDLAEWLEGAPGTRRHR